MNSKETGVFVPSKTNKQTNKQTKNIEYKDKKYIKDKKKILSYLFRHL